MKPKSKRLKMILMLGCLTILVACQTTMPPLPTKPILNMMTASDGGLCFDPESTRKLSIYILELERGYSQ